MSSPLYVPTPRLRPERLYHYTDARGVLGILDDRVMWATNINYLNDESEGREITRLVRVVLRGLRPEQVAGLEDVMPLLHDLFSDDRRDATGYLDRVFVISLTEDADLLSQWRAYGDHVIGFNTAALARLDGRWALEPCIYEETERLSAVTNVVWGALHRARSTVGFSDPKTVAWQIAREVMAVAPRLKHPSFAEESEWRLIRTLADQEPVKLRAGGSHMVPYVELGLEDSLTENRLDVSLHAGPGPDRERRVRGLSVLINNLRDSHGGGWNAIASASPFRGY